MVWLYRSPQWGGGFFLLVHIFTRSLTAFAALGGGGGGSAPCGASSRPVHHARHVQQYFVKLL
jgi:hypothetical protein